MSEPGRLDNVRIECNFFVAGGPASLIELLSEPSTDLSNLEAVGEPVVKDVALGGGDYLSDAAESPEG